jgi:mRNA interferase MazF
VRVSKEKSGLPMETVFLCFQVRSLDAKRFPKQPAGELSNAAMKKVKDAVRYSLGL